MTRIRFTPAWVAGGAATEVAAWLLLGLVVRDAAEFARLEVVLLGAASAFAYSMALVLCLRIAQEYREAFWMRCGWLALAGNAGVSSARYLLDSYLPTLIWPGYAALHMTGEFREAALLAEFACLLGGILALWVGFHRLGLGFRPLYRDFVLMAMLMTLLAILVLHRENLSEHLTGSAVSIRLQLISTVILGMAAVCSVPLHRLCVQMGGGRMAQFMRLLVLYAVLRSGAIFTGMILLANSGSGPVRVLTTLAWRSTPWIFALAAIVRSGLAEAMVRHAARGRATLLHAVAGGRPPVR